MVRRDDYPLSDVLGPEWHGVTVRGGRWLVLPGWRCGFTPGDLRSLFWQAQQARVIAAERDQVMRDLERTRAALEEAERRAAWYRSQLAAESRMGALFAALAFPQAPDPVSK